MVNDRYRLMFVVRFPQQLAYLTAVGVDFNTGTLFSVLLYSPDDNVRLNYNTSHYPQDLIAYLEKQKELIDSGFYDIRSWQMHLYDEKITVRKDLLKEKGTKKWNSIIVPELELLHEGLEENGHNVEKPVLDDYEYQEIDNKIGRSLETQKPLIFKIYEQGRIIRCGGIVAKIDPIYKRIEIRNAKNRIKKISFSNICGVEST